MLFLEVFVWRRPLFEGIASLWAQTSGDTSKSRLILLSSRSSKPVIHGGENMNAVAVVGS